MSRTHCPTCHVPADAGYFDESTIKDAPRLGDPEVLLAEYRLHRNYAGVLLYFAQFAETAQGVQTLRTPDYRWEIRSSGRPLDPYLAFNHIINPWGMSGFPLGIRLDDGAVLQLVVSCVGPASPLTHVGGRLVGRYWYDAEYGGAPNPL